MLSSLRELLKDRAKLIYVRKDQTVREALTIMAEHNFSQLPIVDEHGHLTGLFSHSTLARAYYQLDPTTRLLDLPVDQCQTQPTTRTLENDIVDTLGDFEDEYVVVVVDNHKPVGILTDYDLTRYFRTFSEDFMFVQDVELTLRRYIEAVLPTEQALRAASIIAFGSDTKDQQRPRKTYDKLAFGDHIKLITEAGNWPQFEPYFQPQEYFSGIMNKVAFIRNQLAHFRSHATPVQRQTLRMAVDWLESRPRAPQPPGISIQLSTVNTSVSHAPATNATGKYDAFQAWLRDQEPTASGMRVSFDELEHLLQEPLPVSALEHNSWWENDTTYNALANAWLSEQWEVADVDLNSGEVTFRRRSQEETELQPLS